MCVCVCVNVCIRYVCVFPTHGSVGVNYSSISVRAPVISRGAYIHCESPWCRTVLLFYSSQFPLPSSHVQWRKLSASLYCNHYCVITIKDNIRELTSEGGNSAYGEEGRVIGAATGDGAIKRSAKTNSGEGRGEKRKLTSCL